MHEMESSAIHYVSQLESAEAHLSETVTAERTQYQVLLAKAEAYETSQKIKEAEVQAAFNETRTVVDILRVDLRSEREALIKLKEAYDGEYDAITGRLNAEERKYNALELDFERTRDSERNAAQAMDHELQNNTRLDNAVRELENLNSQAQIEVKNRAREADDKVNAAQAQCQGVIEDIRNDESISMQRVEALQAQLVGSIRETRELQA